MTQNIVPSSTVFRRHFAVSGTQRMVFIKSAEVLRTRAIFIYMIGIEYF